MCLTYVSGSTASVCSLITFESIPDFNKNQQKNCADGPSYYHF